MELASLKTIEDNNKKIVLLTSELSTLIVVYSFNDAILPFDEV